MKNAPSIWQRYIDQLLGRLDGVVVFFDNIKFQGSSPEELLNRLEVVLKILREDGLRLNKDKCEFFKTALEYLGFHINQCGIHKTTEKVKAIATASAPKNQAELKSLLGLINHYAKFLPNFATIAEPFYRLLRGNQKFSWMEDCDEALRLLKEEVISDRVLIPYDAKLPIFCPQMLQTLVLEQYYLISFQMELRNQ